MLEGELDVQVGLPYLSDEAQDFWTERIEEAEHVRNWVLERIEVAALLKDEDARRRALTFVVVGGAWKSTTT